MFSNGASETRYLREIMFGCRRPVRYYPLTTANDELPPESTWWIMTHWPGNLQQQVGTRYGLRTWIEYGFQQSNTELDGADCCLTDYRGIETGWDMVCRA